MKKYFIASFLKFTPSINRKPELNFLYYSHLSPPAPFFLLIVLLITQLLHTPSASAAKVEPAQYQGVSKSTVTLDATDFLGTGDQVFSIDISGISVDPATITGNKTGVTQPLSPPIMASQLTWESISGGYVARFRVSANDQVKRLRLHLTFGGIIQSLSFRLKGNLNHLPIGPIGNNHIYDGEIWLPITDGNSADLEIFVETISPEMLNFKIDSLSLIIVNSIKKNDSSIVPQSLNLAKNIHHDLTCWSGSVEYPALESAASSTAFINYVKNGESLVCTGTLLNDSESTYTPWFITADHCISDQTTANTAEFEWFLQADACDSAVTDHRYQKTYGGAELLWNDMTNDVSFFKLRELPPSTVTFAGWNTDIQIGDRVWSAHHPNSDHTMVGSGVVTELLKSVFGDGEIYRPLDVVKYEHGGTESGSSGSGIFKIENGYPYWKGTLYGGPVDDYQTSFYSHFSNYYGNLKQWLSNPINCLFNWAENFYPNFLAPAGTATQVSSGYTYRYYGNTNAYLAIPSSNDRVYYRGPDEVWLDVGNFSDWLQTASCS